MVQLVKTVAINTTLPGGREIQASDEIEGVNHQKVKIGVGVSGAYTDISYTNPIPIIEKSDIQELVLIELRKISLYLSVMSGENITETDVGVN